MTTRRLIAAGEAYEDLIFAGLDRLPAPGEELRAAQFTVSPGGGAVITAVAAARLGARVTLVSALAPAMSARLRAERLNVRNLRRPGEPQGVSVALSTPTDRSFVTVDGVNTALAPRIARTLAGLRAAHVHLAFFPRDCRVWQRHVMRLRRRGMRVSWDFGWNETLARDPGLGALIASLDFVCLNESEARLYTGAGSLDDALARLRAQPVTSIVKQGANGSRWIAGDGEYHAPAVRVRTVVDTTGAGDAFNGGFLWALLGGLGPPACLAIGNAVAAASLARAGGLDGLPTLNALPARLRRLAPV
ncbi:MAG: carbohydrate kinase family protein [Acidobacteriota bacterium]